MRIEVTDSKAGLTATLRDRDEFKSFVVEVASGIPLATGLQTVDGAVRFEGEEQAWVDQAWLRETGGFDVENAAAAGLVRMLEYAVRHGWLDAGSGAIAAHVERVETDRAGRRRR